MGGGGVGGDKGGGGGGKKSTPMHCDPRDRQKSTRLEMYLVVAEDSQLQPPDLSSQLPVGLVVLLPEAPRGEKGLQEAVEVLHPNKRASTEKG